MTKSYRAALQFHERTESESRSERRKFKKRMLQTPRDETNEC